MVRRRSFRDAEHTGHGISMQNWWEAHNIQPDTTPRQIRAVAYYRHSAQDRQENSIPIQQDQVREWARANGVEIIQEFADHGRSGLTAEGRPAFTDMMENWVKVRHDFQYILCLDVSRCGRFQDIDLYLPHQWTSWESNPSHRSCKDQSPPSACKPNW
jgi:hypothetical protein